jgi:hypothetical protein
MTALILFSSVGITVFIAFNANFDSVIGILVPALFHRHLPYKKILLCMPKSSLFFFFGFNSKYF